MTREQSGLAAWRRYEGKPLISALVEGGCWQAETQRSSPGNKLNITVS